MSVEIVVDNMRDFAQAEMYLFKLTFDRYVKFEIFIMSTGETYFYETQYQPEYGVWLIETI